MSVNRIDARFQQLRTEGRAGFIAYICGGDPSLQATRDLVIAFEKAGVDLVEIGVPFSDPLADGVVNQMASTRALAGGATLHGVFNCIREIRRESQRTVLPTSRSSLVRSRPAPRTRDRRRGTERPG